MSKIRPEIASAMTPEERIAAGVDAQGNALPVSTTVEAKPGFFSANKKYFVGAGIFGVGAGAGYGAKAYIDSRKTTSA